MNKFEMKTYKDSYLYKNKVSKTDKDDPEKRTNLALLDFIRTSDRIENKMSDAFRGVSEDVKRRQSSSILYTVLLMDKVKLCIGNYELPRAFKVFEAYDPLNNKIPTVFIDCTGIIEFKGGFYVCKKPDILCTYLGDALIYLLYRNFPNKIMDNSSITIPMTDCYISMFDYILDYLRVVGYSSKKEKISYLVGLFFLNNMMGKELDQYTKNIAAKIAGITQNDAKAFDLFIEDGMFDDINSFIDVLADTFELKGLTLEVFVHKWVRLYGTGTQYGMELFTSFLILLLNAYSGSYIVNQRQIETHCGASNLTKIVTNIMNIGTAVYDRRAYMSESELAQYEVHDANTMKLAETIKAQDESFQKIIRRDFFNKELLSEKVASIIEACEKCGRTDRLDNIGVDAIREAIDIAVTDPDNYNIGNISFMVETFNPYMNSNHNYQIETILRNNLDKVRENIQEDRFCDEAMDEASIEPNPEKLEKYDLDKKDISSLKSYLNNHKDIFDKIKKAKSYKNLVSVIKDTGLINKLNEEVKEDEAKA